MLQAQISAIMDVLMKAAVAEIGQLLEDDAAALHQEIRRRNEEIQKRNEDIQRRNEEIQELKTRLLLTETKLQRFTAHRCSIGVQVEMMDTSVVIHSRNSQTDRHSQEKTIIAIPEFSEEKPRFSQSLEMNSHALKREITPFKPSEAPTARAGAEDEELSGLEFEMKIEQVEELVDKKLNQVQAEQNIEVQTHCEHAIDDRNSHLWPSAGHPGKDFVDPESLIECDQQSQTFTDPYVSQVLMEDPMSSQSTSGLFGAGVVLENDFSASENKDIEYNLNLLTAPRQDSHRLSPTQPRNSLTDSNAFITFSSSHSSSCLPKTLTQTLYVDDHPRRSARPKPFQCEECGKGFTQKTRLITHRRIHTGEKPFRCQLCGKMFSRQDNCLRHVRLHSGQRS